MRLLWVLGFVQTGCLVALLFLVSNDSAPPERDVWSKAAPASSRALPVSDIASSVSNDSRPDAIKPAMLRRIVREELALHADRFPSAPASNDGNPTSRPHRADPQEVEAVQEEIEYHQRTGSIAGSEMDELMQKIAKLDSANRKAMLSKLMRSINDGEIDGRM